jgi:hypothetical protein
VDIPNFAPGNWHRFANAPVSIMLPHQGLPGNLRLRTNASGLFSKRDSPGFNLGRELINFEFYDAQRPNATLRHRLSQALKLRVEWNQNDLNFAKSKDSKAAQPKLAKWNGSEWVVLPTTVPAGVSPSAGHLGVVEVEIVELSGDPPLGWGG